MCALANARLVRRIHPLRLPAAKRKGLALEVGHEIICPDLAFVLRTFVP